MPKYAADTNVSSEVSRLEIEKVLVKYGAENFAYATTSGKAMIGFTMCDRQVRFILPLPRRDEFQFTPEKRIKRSENSQQGAWEQACRQRWRALLLKLEAAECGISTFEQEFMANIVLPDGNTAGDFLLPQIATAYERGTMPEMLPMLEER